MLEKLGLKETIDVVRFIRGLEFNQLPSDVVHKAKQCIFDTIGCILGGAVTTEHANIVIEVIKQLGGKPQATIFADGLKTSTFNAALANGTSGHSHDLDDAHRHSFFHVGVGSIPAVLALAEQHGKSGQEVITATVAAFEVSIRIALAVNPALRVRGYHTTGTCGTFGGAVGAAKILGLTEEQILNTMGLAGTQAAGLLQTLQDGDMSKRMHPGKSAANGILAALLAQKGYTGPYRVFEGTHGFPAAYAGEYNLKLLREGLGESFRIMEVGLKIHAACRYTHTPIDAALLLREKHGIKPEQVEKGEVLASKLAADQLKKQDVETFLDGQISGPFCVALALIHGKTGHQDFMAGIRDQTVLDLAKKIKMVEDPQFGLQERTCIVNITTKDGNTFSQQVELGKGEPEVPLSAYELEGKFRDLASQALSNEKIDQAVEMLTDLEKLDDFSKLVMFLVP
jgi:2-methylcitrate dehydratase PrpD